jgi:hypothetical protein
MIRDLCGDLPPAWMNAVLADAAALRSFVNGLRHDLAAVTAGSLCPGVTVRRGRSQQDQILSEAAPWTGRIFVDGHENPARDVINDPEVDHTNCARTHERGRGHAAVPSTGWLCRTRSPNRSDLRGAAAFRMRGRQTAIVVVQGFGWRNRVSTRHPLRPAESSAAGRVVPERRVRRYVDETSPTR